MIFLWYFCVVSVLFLSCFFGVSVLFFCSFFGVSVLLFVVSLKFLQMINIYWIVLKAYTLNDSAQSSIEVRRTRFWENFAAILDRCCKRNLENIDMVSFLKCFFWFFVVVSFLFLCCFSTKLQYKNNKETHHKNQI